MERMRVAVTGADGVIGGILRDSLADRFDVRPLTRRDADITDLPALQRVLRGTDALVHLAADAAVDASWDDVLAANVIGVYHAFEAARLAGVQRVIFASSNHAMGMYMWDHDRFADPTRPIQTGTAEPTRPDSLYGASKVWGEAIGRLYSERHGLVVVCLRIGWVTEDDEPPTSTEHRREPPTVARRAPGMWLSHRDCASLVEAALTADLRFAIVNGVSDNTGRWFSLDQGRRLLGWEPQDGIR
ncbi:MAG: NAD(P)-dependent oxidoreductase [Chloroflexota bacterium]|nr:NAD(P)-dependent oxidoreductase [Chloroflexota bacterium]